MKYRINEVKNILNIKEETLRYYDNKNIIKTIRDKNNNYRYFKATDINKIFAYKMYRSLLFSSADAKQLVSGGSEAFLTEKLQEQLDFIEREQQYLEQASRHILCLQQKLRKWDTFPGGFQLTQSPEYYYHPNQTADSFILNEPVFENTCQCFQYFPAIWPCFHYDSSSGARFSFGYGLYTDHIQPSDEFLHLPPSKCLYTMFSLETELASYLDTLLDLAEDYCRQNNCTLTGNLYGNILHEIKKDDHTSRLFDVYLPVT